MASMGSDPKNTVHAPAIALLVTGILYPIFGLLCCGNGAFALAVAPQQTATMNKDEKFGYNLSVGGQIASGIFGLVVSAVMIYGALQMMKLKSYGLAMTSSILALLPCHVCCVAGLPIGIWSLIILMKPEVKSAFS